MKLKRLRIEQVRQFRQPLEIKDFEDGINLFTGPNESGKSSIVRAIRAAFLERHRSSSVDDLCPWGDSSATPTVELDFSVGDQLYSLTKSFLHRKRCELKVGTQRLESADAEDRLAELLGFQFAAKGASKPEHWGIPGLLWIEQGSGQQVHDAVGYATDHLRSALNESLGEVASNGGDEVLDRVRAERAELLTSTGKPTGQLSKVTADLAAARVKKAEIEGQIAAYRQQVDELENLRQQHVADEAERPWEAFRKDLATAQTKYDEVLQLDQKLVQDRSRLTQYNATLELLRQQLTDLAKQEHELVTRESVLTKAKEAVEKAQASFDTLVRRQQAVNAAYKEAREALRLARQEEQRVAYSRTIKEAQPRLEVLAESIKAAQAAQEDLAKARQQSVAMKISKADLASLQEQYKQLRELEIQKAAIATRLQFNLEPGKSIVLDGESISGTDEKMLVSVGELGIPGVGRIMITPGGTDLAELAREQDELQEAHDALLMKVGVTSLSEAEQRYANHQHLLLDIKQAEQTLGLHAPKGIEALQAEESEINTRVSEAKSALEALPSAPEEPVLSQQKAQEEQDRAREALDDISREVSEAKQALATTEADRDNAQRERDALHQTLNDPARQQRQQDTNQKLLDTKAEHDALKQRINALNKEVEDARPDILKQDIDRLRRSAEQLERAHRSRGEDIIRVQAQLEAAGAQGLEELGATVLGQVEQLERRHTELSRRAEALDLLLGLLEAKRRELTHRLQAPLQKYINNYLNLLFPHASLEIDQDLTPGPFTRPSARGEESGEFDELSFGAREQMGVLSRLAYADLLKEAGRPTLIILDDALVHSDEQRLNQMKRILFAAAQRHQILLFTCHPKAWRDLGVTARQVTSLIREPA